MDRDLGGPGEAGRDEVTGELEGGSDGAMLAQRPLDERPSRALRDPVRAAVIDFGDIEAESQKQMDKIVSNLRKTFDRISIVDSGYALLHDGRGDLLEIRG